MSVHKLWDIAAWNNGQQSRESNDWSEKRMIIHLKVKTNRHTCLALRNEAWKNNKREQFTSNSAASCGGFW